MRVRRSMGVTLALALAPIATGCAYHNVIHNGERLFAVAEAHRRAARPAAAREAYTDVVRKTGVALRARPESDWAADALLLLGRSRLRLGELREARAALTEARARRAAIDPRVDELVYLAAVRAETGDTREALDLVNRALDGALDPHARAEGHLLRARLLFARSLADQGSWDLDRAVEHDPALAVEAAFEQLRWAIRDDAPARATYAMSVLLGHAEAAAHVDSVIAMVRSASARWGPDGASELLVDVGRATWEQVARGRAALERARQLDASGDRGEALSEAVRVAAGRGAAAAEARLLLSSWQLEQAREMSDALAVRALLLPVSADSAVAARLDDLSTLARLVDAGLEDPIGWFAAGEVARDRLGASYVARGLFLAYADAAPQDAWVPKSLLAAIDTSPAHGDRAWIRGRLEAYGDSPYVLAARGRPAAGYPELEEELEVRLGDLRVRR